MFVHVGMNNYVNSDEVYMIIKTGGGHARSIRGVAEREAKFYNLTGGRAVKSLIIYKNGVVAGSAITAATLRERLNTPNAVRLGNTYMSLSSGGVAAEDTDNDDFYLEEREEIDDDEEETGEEEEEESEEEGSDTLG